MAYHRRYRFWKGFASGATSSSLLLALMMAARAAMEVGQGALPSSSQEVEAPDQGVTDFGVETSLSHPITHPSYKRLNIRTGCKWGKPGANPFKGDRLSALLVEGVDPESAKELASRIERGLSDGEVIFSNTSIRERSGDLEFVNNYAMAFGNSVCFNTKTNFEIGHYELAALYRHNGYYIVVPYVCGNITRLVPQTQEVLFGNFGKSLDTAYQQGYEDGYTKGRGEARPSWFRNPAAVSEPPTFFLLTGGLIVFLVARWVRKRKLFQPIDDR